MTRSLGVWLLVVAILLVIVVPFLVPYTVGYPLPNDIGFTVVVLVFVPPLAAVACWLLVGILWLRHRGTYQERVLLGSLGVVLILSWGWILINDAIAFML